MTAYNVVRFKVKTGRDKEFIALNKEQAQTKIKGLRKGALIKTGERTYCFIAEWDSFAAIVAARSQLIGNLDKMRALLEDLGGGLGVTDPVSGESVVEF
jgi:hypothetical protein